MPHFLFAQPFQTLFGEIHQLFGPLRKLDITFSFPAKRNRIGGAARTGDLIAYEKRLQQFLHAADSLEELKVAGTVNVATLKLEATCGKKIWRSLRVVELRHFSAEQDHLQEFISRHSLQYLLLEDFNLLSSTQGDWEDLIDHIAGHHPSGLKIFVGYVWQNGLEANPFRRSGRTVRAIPTSGQGFEAAKHAYCEESDSDDLSDSWSEVCDSDELGEWSETCGWWGPGEPERLESDEDIDIFSDISDSELLALREAVEAAGRLEPWSEV